MIATCYNHERYVEECLESIRNQTYENVQLIVVDDCSTDRSVKVIRSWLARTGTPCTLITHRVNRGICRSRNDAHRRARGRYVSMIATDDTWVPDKLAIQVPMMESLPADVAVLYGDATTMDENSATRPEMVIDLYGYLDSFPDGWVFDDLLRGNFVTSLTALVRRRCIDAVGGYDEALIYEDWDLWLSLSRRYRFVFTPQVFGRYRILENSLVHVLHGERRLEFFESSLRIARKNAGVSEASDDAPALPDERAGLRARAARAPRARASLRPARPAAAVVGCLAWRLPGPAGPSRGQASAGRPSRPACRGRSEARQVGPAVTTATPL